MLAAGLQERVIRPADLVAAVTEAPRVRHRAALLAAVYDIAGGAQALSEIDFARLCRSAALPPPTRQALRRDRFGRRRCLDAQWLLPSRRRIVAEVDGALHLLAQHWWDDQLRQNELRYPSVVVRCEPELVINQLRRVLLAS